jgi:glycogen debranching enzyme
MNKSDTILQKRASDAPEETPAQFFIPAAVSLQERRPFTLKCGDLFGVFDHNGDAASAPGRPEGIFYRDTRHLSHLFLSLHGARPILLSSALRDDNATLTCDLANPDLYDADGHLAVPHDIIHIRRSRFIWNGACFERIFVRNFDERSREVVIGVAFAADFRDLFEVRGHERERRGEMHNPIVEKNYLTLSYTGLDKVRRTTTLRFDPEPTRLSRDQAMFRFTLGAGESRSLFVEIDCVSGGAGQQTRRAFLGGLRDARRALRRSAARAAAIVTSNEVFNEAARRSVSDLYMLATDVPEGLYPYAGIPWFSTVFGRDALITALETLWLDPMIARGVLGHLAAEQATEVDPLADAEPGKILHEVRHGEMAALGEVPFRHYYGSVDSTPLFVMLAGAYLERTGDSAFLRGLWPHIEKALDWIERYGDRDGDGFIEYGRQNDEGLINQGWKDSHDSIFHADGSLAHGPIAVVEAQAYVYAAWRAAEQIARRLDGIGSAAKYEAKAEELRRRFDESFFDEELGLYVLALDGDKRPCRVRSSNAGHALFAGVAYPERAASVARVLTGSSFFCGWGVRTIATTEARYNPMSYHNGSVWPHDNAMIAAGFARYGFRREAAKIFEGVFAASTFVDLRRLPELFCGFPRQRTQGPTSYPVACIPQAWAAAAPLSMIQSCIGLVFDPNELRLIFEEPVLPRFLNEIVLDGLKVKDASAKIALRRSGRHVVVDVLERSKALKIIATS